MSNAQRYPYPQPYYPSMPVTVVAAPSNGAATAALVFGLLTMLTCGLTAIPALICGVIGLSAGRRENGTGRTSAMVGAVFGGVWVLGFIVLMVAAICGMLSDMQ